MTAATHSEADLAAVRHDLAALKVDIGSLIAHLRSSAGTGVQNAADQVGENVRGLSHQAAKEGERSVKAIGVWVGQQPLLAFLIALSVGYVGVRAILR
jgi:cyclopropane fatty-acyl-phospholipid synthase-like methyltransferase